MRNALIALAAALLIGCSSESSPEPCDPKVENGARISTRGAAPSVCVSQTLELALDLWECATNAEVTPYATWSSDKPNLATVDKGVVLGVAPGTVTIAAHYSGRADSATIEVVACP